MVGSELLTGLYVAAGVTDQLFLDSGSTLDRVGHGAGQLRDIMFSWRRPMAVLTSQVFLSDEEGELEMPLRINGGRASQQQEVDFNYCYNCPQKIKQAERVGPAVNQWDWHCIIDIICWFCKWLHIPKLGPRNGLCENDEKYKWKSCTGTAQLLIQSPGGDSEVSGSRWLRPQEETTGSVDRKGKYDDADWFNDNPNRAGGTVVARTDATVAQYCSCKPLKTSLAYSVWWPISSQHKIFCYMSYLIMEAWLSSFPMIPISLVYSFSGMNDSFMNGVGVPSVKCQISISAGIGGQYLPQCNIFY